MPVLLAVLSAVAVLVAGCTSPDGRSHDPYAGGRVDGRHGCGPLAFDEVRGHVPPYLPERLDRWPDDHAACAGVWLRTGTGFVPQGVAVEGDTAWVSGFDAGARLHYRYCRIEKVDLRSGRRLHVLDPVAGQVGDRDPLKCRHGGGLVRDEHGLWLIETSRLWLIDPDTLTVDRVWALSAPLRGSFAVLDGTGRLGVGRWYPHRRAQVDWFDTDALVSSTALDITTAMSTGSTSAPRATQGAVWGAFGGARAGVWFDQSVTRCGILVGPPGSGRRGFVPGAEGMDLVGDHTLWVVSEAGARHYQALGGRPVVPMLVRLDTRDLGRWSRPHCSV